MKQIIKIGISIIIVLFLVLFSWLKSIEVHQLEADNERLFDKLNLQNENSQKETQAYKDTLRVIRGLNKKQESVEGESFEHFLNKFYSDSAFQLSRIVFPLAGIDTDMMEMDDTIFYFQRDNWMLVKKEYPEIDRSIRKIYDDKDSKVDKIYIEDSGFMIERWFKLINGKWFLTFYVYANT